jgi:geranylgeranyl reductase family protein
VNDQGGLIDEAEVVVVGGGPAGSVAAAKLAEQGTDVLLIDQSAFPRDKPCGDGLAHGAVAFLQQHGLEAEIERAQPIEDVRVIVAHGSERKGFYRPWPPEAGFARVMPRRMLDNSLFDVAMSSGARFLKARVDRPVLTGGQAEGVMVTGDATGRVSARCVIAADGATSRIRRTTGIGRERPGSQIYALRLYVDTTETLEPFFDFYVPLNYGGGLLAGYGWVFPVSDHQANIGVAYYEPPPGRPRARIREVLDSFMTELEQRASHRLGQITNPSDPIGAPIATQFSSQRNELGNLIFAGEAARVADALNGEGISFTLHSGAFAAEEAHRLLKEGRQPAAGVRTARRFTRLGQDLTLPARLVAAVSTGLPLIDKGRKPFLTRVGRAASIGPDNPSLELTEAGSRLVESDAELLPSLRRLDDRLLDTLRTTYPFALETMHRELRARGAISAAVTLAVARGVDREISEEVVAAAIAVELIGLIGPCLREVEPRAGAELTRFNNVLSQLTAGFVMTRAGLAATDGPTQFQSQVVKLTRQALEALARTLEPTGWESVLTEQELHGSMNAELAACGAMAALGEDPDDRTLTTVDAARRIGHAWQLSSEIRELTIGNDIAARPSGAELRDGILSLPVAYAFEVDSELATLFETRPTGDEFREGLSRIRASGAIERAEGECADYVSAALEGIEAAGLERPGPLRSLAQLCQDRLPGLGVETD